MDIEELRRRNVQLIIDEEFDGVAAKLAEKINRQASEISRRLNPTGKESRNFGPTMRRLIEQATGKPPGWLDQDHGKYAGSDLREAIGNEIKGFSIQELKAIYGVVESIKSVKNTGDADPEDCPNDDDHPMTRDLFVSDEAYDRYNRHISKEQRERRLRDRLEELGKN